MNATCNAINSQADPRLIYEEVFLPPHPILRRYVVNKDHIEFRMELAVLLNGPGVIFSSTQTGHWTGWFQRRRGADPDARFNTAYQLVIDPATVTDADLQLWFTYLLSGLRSSLKPQTRKDTSP